MRPQIWVGACTHQTAHALRCAQPRTNPGMSPTFCTWTNSFTNNAPALPQSPYLRPTIPSPFLPLPLIPSLPGSLPPLLTPPSPSDGRFTKSLCTWTKVFTKKYPLSLQTLSLPPKIRSFILIHSIPCLPISPSWSEFGRMASRIWVLRCGGPSKFGSSAAEAHRHMGPPRRRTRPVFCTQALHNSRRPTPCIPTLF